MSAISDRFEHLRSRGENALVCFVTAGDPSLDQLPAVLSALEEGGADIIEVGVPFSDPIADGPTIQASSQRALDRGTRVDDIFRALAASSVSVPVVLMGYTNTAMRHGFADFARRAVDAGISGVILSDLTPDDAGEWREVAGSLDTIFLAAPTSTEERIRAACAASRGFVYCVSRTGVTGAGSEMPPDVVDTVLRVKACTELPVCVGFGISRPDQVRAVCSVAEGAVVGSYLVDLLHCTEDLSQLRDAVSALKSGTVGIEV